LYFLRLLRIKCASPNYKHPHLSVILIFKEHGHRGLHHQRFALTRCALYSAFYIGQAGNLFQYKTNLFAWLREQDLNL
jgi:hypothetical protein